MMGFWKTGAGFVDDVYLFIYLSCPCVFLSSRVLPISVVFVCLCLCGFSLYGRPAAAER